MSLSLRGPVGAKLTGMRVLALHELAWLLCGFSFKT